uniref:Arrestin-visual-Y n=1 Tax=Geotria australis TaxID=71168 RepID=A0A2H5ACC7_9VERT|nr:arrestin-visual-Y [Geotria australis]
MAAKAAHVFKKTSSNGKVTVYMAKRDFIDHLDYVDPVDGVVYVDPAYIKGRKVFVTLTCAFRYGREDLDVMGIPFRRDIHVIRRQLYPPNRDPQTGGGGGPPQSAGGASSALQEKLLNKLGGTAYAFSFSMPQNLPCSVMMQPAPSDKGKSCGVDFEVKAFCCESLDEDIKKKHSVSLLIRKVQYAPEKPGIIPSGSSTVDSDSPVTLAASLDKEVYYHGQPIRVSVSIKNGSSKHVKKMKITVDQISDVVLYCQDKYTKTVCCEEPTDVVGPQGSLSAVYTVTPLAAHNREKRGIALDGKLKHDDTNLASTTRVSEGVDREVMGILVSYVIRVKALVSRNGILGDIAGSDLLVELPFTLMHPTPMEDIVYSEVSQRGVDIVVEDFARKGEEVKEEEAEDEAEQP